jgi:hypothetical protein
MPFIVRHASKRPSGTRGNRDYDVMSGDFVGSLFRTNSASQDQTADSTGWRFCVILVRRDG